MWWVLLISAALYLLLLTGLCLPWWFWKKAVEPSVYPPLSVLVAARNEAHELPELLACLLEQDYPAAYEICLVLDRCTDQSLEIAAELLARHSHLQVLEINQLPDGWAGKKYALTQGIEQANYECLAFTDADCRPGPGWLKAVGRHFAEDKDLVLGLGPYQKGPGLLNAFVRYETFYTALQYIGWAKWGMPYMAVGRSLAYRKKFFRDASGFDRHQGRLSGDDDLLINHANHKQAPALMLEEEARVYSETEKSWQNWWSQKIRHLSAGTSYNFRSKVILSLFHGLHSIFYLSLIFVLCGSPRNLEGFYVFLVRDLAMMLLFLSLTGKWKNNIPVLLFPLLDILYFLYNMILVPASIFLKPTKWKGK